MKKLQSVKNLLYVVYSIINNNCHTYDDCIYCNMNEGSTCGYHSRINNNNQLSRSFGDRFSLSECCDYKCRSCVINRLSNKNMTCGLSVYADNIIKYSKRILKETT